MDRRQATSIKLRSIAAQSQDRFPVVRTTVFSTATRVGCIGTDVSGTGPTDPDTTRIIKIRQIMSDIDGQRTVPVVD